MMKLAVFVVMACVLAAASAQLLYGGLGGLGAQTYSQQSSVQSHAPWAASASARSQLHGPDAALLGVVPQVPLGGPLAGPLVYLRR